MNNIPIFKIVPMALVLVILLLPKDVSTQAIACKDIVNVDFPVGDSVTLHPRDFLEGNIPDNIAFSNDDADTIWVIKDGHPGGIYTIVHVPSGNRCWGRLRVNCDRGPDITPPIAIANNMINFSLDQSGQAIVEPFIVDQGSYDNCSDVTLQIRRSGMNNPCSVTDTSWKDSEILCCKDIGETVVMELLVTDESGNSSVVFSEIMVEDKLGIFSGCIIAKGTAFIDDNDNCLWDGGEEVLPNAMIRVTSNQDTLVTTTADDGSYVFYLNEEEYEFEIISPSWYWKACPSQNIQIEESAPTPIVDLGLKKLIDCPDLQVEVSSSRIRRCRNNNYVIEAINYGTIAEANPIVQFTLDQYHSLVSCSHAYTALGGQTYEIKLQSLEPYEKERIKLVIFVDCDSTEVGQSLCLDALILPDTFCIDLSPVWTGADVVASSWCEGDSVRLSIKNEGSGDMSVEKNYWIIEDDIVLYRKRFKLDVASEIYMSFEATGSTFRVVAEQPVGHPYPGRVSAAAEACVPGGGSPSLGFISSMGLGSTWPNAVTYCSEIVGSYDPNEKKAFPVGFGDDHQILPDELISYTIYFQNTGNDTAFDVYLLDTISTLMDLSTLKMGASSHDFEYEIFNGNILKFAFNNIMLPDSNVNEPGSNGFVQYTLSPFESVELGSVVTNKAGIYFDFNAPIITNEVFHTIDTTFIDVSTNVVNPRFDNLKITVSPNPFHQFTRIAVGGHNFEELNLDVYDMLGQRIFNKAGMNTTIELDAEDFKDGVYNYVLTSHGVFVASGLLIKK